MSYIYKYHQFGFLGQTIDEIINSDEARNNAKLEWKNKEAIKRLEQQHIDDEDAAIRAFWKRQH